MPAANCSQRLEASTANPGACVSAPTVYPLEQVSSYPPDKGHAIMKSHFIRELRTTFAYRARNPAITHRGRSYSFGELDAHAQRCAAWLRSLGVSPGDRVALCTHDKLAFLAAHLGALYAGAVSLPLNP